MLLAKATRSENGLKKDNKYYIGGMVQNTKELVLMDMKFNIVPGRFSADLFDSTPEEVLLAIEEGKYELKQKEE
jgi:hypothetical protein